MNSIYSGLNLLAIASIFGLGVPGFSFAADDSHKPESKVPPVTYRSAFRETSLGVEQSKVDWRKANDDVGKFTRGHVDIIKQEALDSKGIQPKASSATPAATHKH